MYINTTTLSQLSESEIRALYPNTSFPSPFVPPEEFDLIFPAPQPTHNAVTEMVRALPAELTVKGHHEQRWEVVSRFTPFTDEAGVHHSVESQSQAALEQAQKQKMQAFEQEVERAIEKRLNDFALTRGFTDIATACTFVTSGVARYAADGKQAIDARDQTWVTWHALIDEIKAGTRAMPINYAEVEALLPKLEWVA